MYIHKQINPILICIVRFLFRPQDPASLCKPWDRLWTQMLGQHVDCSTTSIFFKCPTSTSLCRLGLELYHDCFQVQDLLWILRHITAHHTLISTITHTLIPTIHLYHHTLISTIRLYQHTLIPTIYLYLYLQPVNTSNTSNTSELISVIALKTVITFHIIHYQVLRHQECVHSLECNQY